MSQLEEDLWLSQHDHVGFFGSVLGGAYLLFTVPVWLWQFYVEYLWNWDAHPWVKNSAATFRLLAILVVAPFALLTLLDVGAYVIARTLGVVETTKASTSDSKDPRGAYPDGDASETNGMRVASSPIHFDLVDVSGTLEPGRNVVATAPEVDMSSPSSSSLASSSASSLQIKPRLDAERLAIPAPRTHFSRASQGLDGPEAAARFFSPSDERLLELSGALLSSPTPSRQASPGLERRHRVQPLTIDRVQAYDAVPSGGSDASSAADSESFTILEPLDLSRVEPEGSDSALDAYTNLRRRGAHRYDDGAIIS